MHKPIPAFEGHPVDGTIVRVSGTAPMDDLQDVVLGVDREPLDDRLGLHGHEAHHGPRDPRR